MSADLADQHQRVPRQQAQAPGQRRLADSAPGLAAAAGLAVVATIVGRYVPLAGSAVPGAVIGAVIAIVRKPGSRLAPGLRQASSLALQCSVVVLGTQLSIGAAARAGLQSLPVMGGTLAVCLVATAAYGRLLGVTGNLRTLIGVGTGICGGSAIAAVSPVIGAAGTEIGYAISTIFLFNITAVIAFPVIGHAIGMSQHAFGLFAGTAVNDTSSVVATATTYGSSAARYAVVVKLVRTLMIIPVSVGLAALSARGSARTAACTERAGISPARLLRLVPWFLIGFLAAAAANSAGLIPSGARGGLSQLSTFLIAMALSAIGLSTDTAALRRAGARPLLLGAALWITVALASLAIQLLTATLH